MTPASGSGAADANGAARVTRTGWGYDAHRFGGPGPIVLCGVRIPSEQGLSGTSDADVALHALIDAMLGAAALGDLGELFPSSDPEWAGADSQQLLSIAKDRVAAAGFRVVAVDVTIVAETVRIAGRREEMRDVVASRLGIDRSAVSVKATSTDGMGAVGRGEGIAAAVVTTVVQE